MGGLALTIRIVVAGTGRDGRNSGDGGDGGLQALLNLT